MFAPCHLLTILLLIVVATACSEDTKVSVGEEAVMKISPAFEDNAEPIFAELEGEGNKDLPKEDNETEEEEDVQEEITGDPLDILCQNPRAVLDDYGTEFDDKINLLCNGDEPSELITKMKKRAYHGGEKVDLDANLQKVDGHYVRGDIIFALRVDRPVTEIPPELLISHAEKPQFYGSNSGKRRWVKLNSTLISKHNVNPSELNAESTLRTNAKFSQLMQIHDGKIRGFKDDTVLMNKIFNLNIHNVLPGYDQAMIITEQWLDKNAINTLYKATNSLSVAFADGPDTTYIISINHMHMDIKDGRGMGITNDVNPGLFRKIVKSLYSHLKK